MRLSSSTTAAFLCCCIIPAVQAQNGNHRLWSLFGGLFDNDDGDGDGILSSTLRQFRQWSDPESSNSNNETTVVPNQFIVRFNDGNDDDVLLDEDTLEQRAALVAKITGGTILHIYRYTFQGVAIVVNATGTKQRATATGPLWTPRRSNGLRGQKLGILEEVRFLRLASLYDKRD
jgi:hypothetical protein